MAEQGRLTKAEWDDLEPRLEEVERGAHARFLANAEARALTGETDHTPGYLLLQRLRELNDQQAIGLFRAVEMYHHELTRANITAAFLRGKEIGRGSRHSERS
jgi:hypothetical protein